MFKQSIAITKLNIQSIPQRLGLSLATVFSIAMVVIVLMGFLAMANGFQSTVSGSGRDDIAVFLRAGSQAELNSGLSRDDVRLIEVAPGVASDPDGNAIVSGELYVIVDGIKRSSQTEANLPLRGVGLHAQSLREGFHITQGRMFEVGSGEVIVGESVLREFQGFDLGDSIRLGTNNWIVVGTFSTGGSLFDSEIWTDIGVIQNLYQRGTTVQSIRARLTSPEAIEGIRTYVADEPRLNLDVSSEREFFADSAGGTSDLIMYLGWPLAIAMAIGALAGAWNTMYSSVDARTREIATLRTIGFSGGAAFVGTMVESMILAAIGGIIGATVSYFLFNGVSASTLGSGFTQIVFSFAVTPKAAASGIVLAAIVGLVGGFIPALRAARVPLLAVHSE